MPFEFHQKVLFKHCDPAGIVFYPRYIEMINDCTEDFFDRVLDWPFEKMLESSGTPTVSTATEFQAPSRHGDQLVLTLAIEKIGRSSLTFTVRSHCKKEPRFSNQTTLVCVDNKGKPASWPDAVRLKIETYRDEFHDS